jgi:hypothetical protein
MIDVHDYTALLYAIEYLECNSYSTAQTIKIKKLKELAEKIYSILEQEKIKNIENNGK